MYWWKKIENFYRRLVFTHQMEEIDLVFVMLKLFQSDEYIY